jgi:integrase
MSIRQVVELAKREGLEPIGVATKNAYIGRMSSLLAYAEKEELITRANPAKGMLFADDRDPRDLRDPFPHASLVTLTNASVEETGAEKWVPLVALYGGLRQGEVCQLRVTDIEKVDGVDVFRVRPSIEDGTRVKTKNARRTVPVHPVLIALGFLDYVMTIGSGCLFPTLKKDHRGGYAQHFSKWFSGRLVDLGIQAEKIDFHSLRYSFRDGLREAHVPQEIARA